MYKEKYEKQVVIHSEQSVRGERLISTASCRERIIFLGQQVDPT